MPRSRKRSGPIERSAHGARRASLSLLALVGLATRPRWLAIADTSVFIRAASSLSPNSPSIKVLEAAAGGLFVLVLSAPIKAEVYDVLQRPRFGFSAKEVDEHFALVWDAARMVEPAPAHPRHAKYTRDPDDVHILETADGVFSYQDLAELGNRFIVRGDDSAFRRGENYGGFHMCSAT